MAALTTAQRQENFFCSKGSATCIILNHLMFDLLGFCHILDNCKKFDTSHQEVHMVRDLVHSPFHERKTVCDAWSRMCGEGRMGEGGGGGERT